ncbi:MAG: putative Ig domain-containing protein [Candidatus Magnetomorum sp.]|nr:putative Ig domain-containing protein [Candidatus Magnetomorum sp.]
MIYSFTFASDTFNDVDAGDSLSYTATLDNDSALPSWLSFNASTRAFTGTPTMMMLVQFKWVQSL